MRIDEIDLIGDFAINGLSPQTGQFLGLSGSGLFWLDPAPSQSGSSIYGNRYVWCNSVAGDQVTSGVNLINAYASASAFIVSATARGAVLVSPGVYDFDSTPLFLTASYIDIIGVSSDPHSVVLRSAGGDYIMQTINSNVDTALCNVTLGPANVYAFDNPAIHTGTYLRWDNVIVRGNDFVDSTLSLGSEGLNGEFKNIKVYDSDYSFYVLSGNLNGKYDNIELNNVTQKAFGSDGGGVKFGTYSNITINGTVSALFAGNGNINATFENIKCGNIDNDIFIGTPINGNFKNIEIGDVGNVAFYSGNTFSGTFENIKIGNVSQNAFSSTDGNITGTFTNIEIGSANNLFHCVTSGDIYGTYKDIVCNNTGAYGFMTTSGTISGTFENITLGDTGEGYFRTDAVGGISGTFKNIEMGDITTEAFYSGAGSIDGTFSNIKTGSIDASTFYSNGDMSGTYENIEIVKISSGSLFYSVGQMNGTFKNITCGTVTSSFMYSESTIGSTFSNIEVGNVGGDSFSSDSGVDVTTTDIKVGNVTGNFFYSVATFSGTFENIEVGDISQNLFSSLGNVNLSIDKLKSGSVASSIFSGVDLKANIKNVDIKEYSGNGFYYTGTSNLYCTIDNLTIGDCNGGVLFHADGDLYGTFSNFKTNNSGMTFEMTQLVRSLNMKNMDLGTCSQLLPNGTSATGNKVLIDNLNVKPSFAVSDFDGTIRNSRIEMLAPNRSSLVLVGGDLSIIERCVFLSTGTWSIGSGGSTPFISFTRASGGIEPTITNKLGSALEAKNILE